VTILPSPAPGLRERKRLAAMRLAQRRAVELFTERGFDAVTVQDVADASDVSAVSLYRWFGTKERLVLWDEYDPTIFAAIADRLPGQPPLEAVRDALVAELDRLYDAEHELVLARTKLIYREPALLAATTDDMKAMQAALAALFGEAGTGGALEREVLAVSCVGVLVTAIDHWQRENGATPLATHIIAGFDVLRGLTWTS
jgi:AcrR family transcriptional regulator